MKIQVLNVRFGFATNSSSTHSLLFLPENHNVHDRLVDGEDFGWQFFTAISDDTKRKYLAHLLRYQMGKAVPENISRVIIENWTGTQYNPDGYIDHQNVLELPRAFGSIFPDEQFFKELLQWALQPNLAVLGGNDNYDPDDPNDRHPLGFGFNLPFPSDTANSSFVCRKEKDYWIFFNTETGDKIRFRFCNNSRDMIVAPQKPLAPELIDLKITNFCPYNCPMCYQDSSNIRKEKEQDTYSLATALAELKVFEVAIGGGEPTWGVHFKNTVKTFHEKGITCNFSTRNLDWLRNPKDIEAIIPYTGAFAFSLISPDDIRDDHNKIKELFSLVNINGIKNKAHLHAIVGPKCFGLHDIEHLLDEANEMGFTITLLGFKTKGRGVSTEIKPNYFKGLIKEIKKWKAQKNHQFASPIGIDTTLASYLKDELKEEGISELLYTAKEGVYSCYIDLVEQKIGPSSYCDSSQMLPLEQYQEQETIIKAFSSF